MRIQPNPSRRARVLGAFSLTATTALLLGACGQAGGTAESPPSTPSETAQTEPAQTETARTETEAAEPRLVVSVGDSAVVLDATSGDEVGRADTAGKPRLSVATDDRHVFLTQTEDNRVDVLDAGSWAAGHGDHFHYYVGDPALRDGMALEGANPVHVVSADGRTGIFFDDDGLGTVFADEGTLVGQFATSAVDGGGPHHGVVVPFGAERSLVSIAPDGEKPLPSSLRLVDGEGTELETYDNACPELHGETVVDDTVVFGCAGQVALVDDSGAHAIDYPADAGDDRVGGLLASPGSDIALGDFGDTSLALIDVAEKTMSVVELGTEYGPRARTADGGHLVLTLDGNLHVLDEQGKETSVIEAIDPFTIGEGHGALAPTIAVTGDRAHVSDPATQSLVTVDLADGKVTDTTDLGGEPSQVVAVNTVHADADEHDHEHGEDDHEEEGE